MQVNDLVKKYVGTPYATHGRSMQGLDCYGLVLQVFDDLGHELFDLADYGEAREWGEHSYIVENYWRQWEKVSRPKALDCVLFLIKGRPTHIGIMLDENRFIHAYRAVKAVTINRLSDGWGERVEGFYRLKAT